MTDRHYNRLGLPVMYGCRLHSLSWEVGATGGASDKWPTNYIYHTYIDKWGAIFNGPLLYTPNYKGTIATKALMIGDSREIVKPVRYYHVT